MLNTPLIINSLLLVLFAVVMIWLVRENLKIKRNHQYLLDYVNNINRDIAGLCSAAVTVDSQLSSNEEQMKSLLEKLADYDQQETVARPYHGVIQKVREGADIAQLMQECRISRDEAALLIRLHGKGRNSGMSGE